jgi:hypothetical protein
MISRQRQRRIRRDRLHRRPADGFGHRPHHPRLGLVAIVSLLRLPIDVERRPALDRALVRLETRRPRRHSSSPRMASLRAAANQSSALACWTELRLQAPKFQLPTPTPPRSSQAAKLPSSQMAFQTGNSQQATLGNSKRAAPKQATPTANSHSITPKLACSVHEYGEERLVKFESPDLRERLFGFVRDYHLVVLHTRAPFRGFCRADPQVRQFRWNSTRLLAARPRSAREAQDHATRLKGRFRLRVRREWVFHKEHDP